MKRRIPWYLIPLAVLWVAGLLLAASGCRRGGSSNRGDGAAPAPRSQEVPGRRSGEAAGDRSGEAAGDRSGESSASEPLYVRALLSAYPETLRGYKRGRLYFRGGGSICCDDGRGKSPQERLDEADVEDMFHEVYRRGDLFVPAYGEDPGRVRCDAFFRKMYGASKKQVRRHLVKVEWFGQSIPFTTVNHAADSLKAVQADILANAPHRVDYFRQSSSFYWRPVRGARRMSAHSYGIAIDLCTEYAHFWQWSHPDKGESDELTYENALPEDIVKIFEKHGFISGTKWYHYDTMHFEFRPELLLYASLLPGAPEP